MRHTKGLVVLVLAGLLASLGTAPAQATTALALASTEAATAQPQATDAQTASPSAADGEGAASDDPAPDASTPASPTPDADTATATPGTDTATPGDVETAPTSPGLQTDGGTAAEGESGPQLAPLAAGPETGAVAPYLYWEARDASGALLGGATFSVAGPRTGNNNWGTARTVTDCTAEPCTGLDLDPDAGEFLVTHLTATQAVSTASRYRVQQTGAPAGSSTTDAAWREIGGTGNTGSWNGGRGEGTHDFGVFTSIPAGSSVVTVKVGAYRSGSTSIENLAGATLGLFSSLAATAPYQDPAASTPWSTCTSDAEGDCVFVIPRTDSSTASGGNRDRELYVKAVSAPAGYHVVTSGSDTPALATNVDSVAATTYGFRVGAVSRSGTGAVTGAQLRSGNVYESSGTGSDFMLSTGNVRDASGGVFAFARDNPDVAQCGIDVALVLDLSGSVAGSQNQLAGAANTLVDALTGTASSVSLYTFSTSSPARTWSNANDTGAVIVPNHPEQQSVSTAAGAATVKSWYSQANGTASFTPSGGTNWDRGLWAVGSSGNDYDVTVVITDGLPTFYAAPPVEGNGSSTRLREVESGIFSANAVKETGSRILAVGVGSGVTSAAAGLNLRALSGDTAGSDYFQTADYDQAGKALQDLISESCAGNVTVVKQVVPSSTTGEDVTGAAPAAGWTFEAGSSDAEVTLPASGTTGESGAVSFPLEFATGQETTSLTFAEQQQPGYALVTQGGKNAVCTDLSTGQAVTVTNDGALGFRIHDVDAGSNVSCVVYNREADASATVTVAKRWTVNGTDHAHGDQPDGLGASLRLSAPGANAGETSWTWSQPRTGYTAGSTVRIGETASIDASLVGCELDAQHVTLANGQTVSVDVAGGGLYEPTLEPGENTFEITNVVTCVTRLTLVKQVVGGDAQPTDWQFTAYTVPATDPAAGQPVAGLTDVTPAALSDGRHGVTSEVDPATYQLAEHDGPPEYSQQFRGDEATWQATRPLATGSWDCGHVDEQLQPVDTWNDGLNGGAVVALGTHVLCTAYNLTGTVTLLKHIVDDPGDRLDPGDFDLTATPAGGVAGLAPMTVDGAEQVDAGAGGNTFSVRPAHDYSLSEASGTAYRPVAVQRYLGDPDAPIVHGDDALWEDVDATAIRVEREDAELRQVYRFVNAPVPAIALPLTGGASADAFLIAGGIVVALAAALAVWARVRRHPPRRSLP